MTVSWRQSVLQHPAYRPELDLVAESTDGRLLGFCIGWIADDHGHLEPLGVRESHRRQGVGAALTTELLRRMWRLGVTECLVEPEGGTTAVAVYQSIGFEIEQSIHLCRKDFPQTLICDSTEGQSQV